MSNFAVDGDGFLPFPASDPEIDGYVSGRDVELNECCTGRWRRWTATGRVDEWLLIDPGPPPAYLFVPIALGARWDFGGSSTYLLGGVTIFASPGQGWDAQVGAFVSYYDGVAPVVTASAADSPVPPFQPLTVLPTRWTLDLWWDSLSPHDVVVTVSVGSVTTSYGTVGVRFTGGGPYLLGVASPPLPEVAQVGAFTPSIFDPEAPGLAGTVTSWTFRCADDPGDWPEVPFDGESCIPADPYVDYFPDPAGPLSIPPYSDPSSIPFP